MSRFADIPATWTIRSWALQEWDTKAPHVWPQTLSKARQLVRNNLDS